MMTSAQVVEVSVNVTFNSPSQDYTHLDDHTPLSYDYEHNYVCYFKLFLLYTQQNIQFLIGQ